MTREEWLSCADPGPMLAFVNDKATPAAAMRFDLACRERLRHLIDDPRCLRALDTAARFADGLVDEETFRADQRAAYLAWREALPDEARASLLGVCESSNVEWANSCEDHFVATVAASQSAPNGTPEWREAFAAERAAQADIARALFGDPTRPDAENPAMRAGLRTAEEWRACADVGPWRAHAEHGASPRKRRLMLVAFARRVVHLCADDRCSRALDVAEAFADGAVTEAELAAARDMALIALDEARHETWSAESRNNFCDNADQCAADAARWAAQAAFQALGMDMTFDPGSPPTLDVWMDPESAQARERYRRLSYAHDAMTMNDNPAAASAGKAAARDAFLRDESASTDSHRHCGTATEGAAREAAAQCDVVRCIFGHRFGPLTGETAWLPEERGRSVLAALPGVLSASVHPQWLRFQDGLVANLAATIYADRVFDLMPALGDALEDAGCDDAGILAHCRDGGVHVRGCWVLDALLGRD